MGKVRLINIKETILSDNRDLAEEIRAELRKEKVFMLNIMASPGAGKTSLIIETLRQMKGRYRFGVIEGDIDSQVDSDKVAAEGVSAVQLRTGGSCHLDAPMIKEALKEIDLSATDVILTENIGNLVCPADFDLGQTRKAMILSVPEGDDKAHKYPLMFQVSDLLVITKTDYLDYSDFNYETLKERTEKLNPRLKIIKTSAKTGEGLEDFCQWLQEEIEAVRA
ncbi:MAG: hydrogenase nickel incorporation protein HypB [Bacillota bacterium]